MAFLVAGIDLQRAIAVLPDAGIWSVRADLVGGKAPPERARVQVVLGDLVLSGTVRHADVFAQRAEVFVVGGADGWGATVSRRPYRADNGVRLDRVAGDLARDAGEALAPLGALAAAVVGYAWVRPEGPAIHALNELGHPWYVDVDGSTHIGARPTVARSGLRLGVDYRPSLRRAVITSPEDAFAALVPGSVISGDGFPSLTIRATTIRVTDRTALAEVDV
ncbi:hypothetical protein [Sorangium cellulosum]|uniref:Uncharacterized protein n=1 Tax=Sorangium cellulosum TaxID=56 RepID=A0A150Q9A3_SORCE|nr:hypothetical protein [Sorangium cellulosum]KYF64530.1 hypothetical protein BE15_04500 [Sorangium cellulosum]